MDIRRRAKGVGGAPARQPGRGQFRGLVQASRALEILQMTGAELIDDNPARRQDIWRVVDTAPQMQ